MKILVYLEVQSGEITPDSLGLAEAFAGRGWDVNGIAFADGSALPAQSLPILVASLPDGETRPGAGKVATIARIVQAQGFDTLLFANSAEACDIAAQLSGLLDAAVLPGLVDITVEAGAPVGLRTTLSESLSVEASWSTPVRIGLFRPAAFAPSGEAGTLAPVVTDYVAADQGVAVTGCEPVARDGVSLRDADIIVGAGRGIGTPEKLVLLRELADVLGGALGVSLPVVDAGWAPRSMQVGQTGTVVQPRLYVACGISGQIQHRIGVERSGIIVAINKDRDAPIMRFCDLAVVGDLNKIVPQLIEALKA